MKHKILTIIFSYVIISLISVGVASAHARADVNNDSNINVLDALLILRKSLDLPTPTWADSSTHTGDVDCNNAIVVVDALFVLRHSVNLVNPDSWCGMQEVTDATLTIQNITGTTTTHTAIQNEYSISVSGNNGDTNLQYAVQWDSGEAQSDWQSSNIFTKTFDIVKIYFATFFVRDVANTTATSTKSIVVDGMGCTLDGLTIDHNGQHVFYSAASVSAEQNCTSISQTRLCNNGTLSGDTQYSHANCSISGAGQSGKSSLGINLGPAVDYWADRIFADVMKTNRGFSGSTDSHGWPTADGSSVIVWHGIDQMNGTYKLIFTGNADITAGYAGADIQNKTYNATTNKTVADLIYANTGEDGLELTFSAPITDVQLMRPIIPGSASSYDTSATFTNEIKDFISQFSAVRYMDFLAANSNKQVTWTDRTLPTDSTQQQNTDAGGYGWEGKGASWEYAIMLANETNTDMYITIPVLADEQYIRQLARLIRDGANGFPALNSNLKCYIEYSNELWNSAGAFGQYINNLQLAQSDTSAPSLGYDGETGEYTLSWRRVGKQTVKISNIFRQEFGDAQMMSRIRPILAWQLGNPQVGIEALAFIQDNYPNPVNYYVYGGGGSAYYSPDNDSDSLSLENIWTSLAFNPDMWIAGASGDAGMKTDVDLIAAYGIEHVSYEGGPGLDNTGHSENIKIAAISDQRMKNLIINHHRYWDEYGGDVLFYYISSHDYQWGFTSNIFDLNTQKLQAINNIKSANKPAITYGNIIPGTISGSDFSVTRPVWHNSNSLNVNEAKWVSYTLNVPSAGTYTFNITLSDGGQAEVYINGSKQGHVTASGIAGPYSVSLPAGLNGLFVQKVNGSVTVDQINVSN